MVTESANQTQTAAELPEVTEADILNGMGMIEKLLMVGAVFAAVGYLLVGAALTVPVTPFSTISSPRYTRSRASCCG